MSLLWVGIFLLMILAGFWQLNRAQQKKQIFSGLSSNQYDFIHTMKNFDELEVYQPFEINGYYLSSPQFLLDNQIYQGKSGYHVITPFYLSDLRAWIMVNRGWVAKTDKKFSLQDHGGDIQVIRGIKSYLPAVAFQLGDVSLNQQDQQIITYYDNEVIMPFLKQRLCLKDKVDGCIILPFIIKLKAGQPNGFVRDWQVGLMKPERHTAYAFQWFSMSLVLMVLYFIFLRKINARAN